MNKRYYERLLCEILVSLQQNQGLLSDPARLESILALAHPQRETAFVQWALTGCRPTHHLSLMQHPTPTTFLGETI